MRDVLEPLDCPVCGAAGAVDGDFCQVCYADVDARDASERRPSSFAGGLPFPGPTPGSASGANEGPQGMLHPSVPPRFTHVVEELREIASEALESGTSQGWRIASACRRAESLLFVLRRHFLQDVILGADPPSAVGAR